MRKKGFLLLSLDCDSKEPGDQCNLPFHITFCHALHLPLANHVHGLKSLEGSPCGFKREKAHPWLCETFDEPMQAKAKAMMRLLKPWKLAAQQCNASANASAKRGWIMPSMNYPDQALHHG